MKKITTLLLSAILMLGLAACGNNTPPSESQPSVSETATPSPSEIPSSTAESKTGSESVQKTDSKTLVVYFSMPETADPDNMSREEELSTVVIDGEVLGNTQYVARVIQENTDADVFRIEPETPYPTDHSELEAVSTKERNQNSRPAIAAKVENIEQYDTIFLGYPNWWADMPMILYSFLEEYDLSGKTIVPFVTSGGSGFSNTINEITKLQPNATVIKDGLSVSRNDAEEAAPDIIAWLADNGYTKK